MGKPAQDPVGWQKCVHTAVLIYRVWTCLYPRCYTGGNVGVGEIIGVLRGGAGRILGVDQIQLLPPAWKGSPPTK